MRSYIPTYLTNIESGPTGWPTALTKNDQDWATARVREIVDAMLALRTPECPQGYRPVLHQVCERMFRDQNHAQPKGIALAADSVLRRAAMWDFMYAVTFRAMLAAGFEQVWEPSKDFRG